MIRVDQQVDDAGASNEDASVRGYAVPARYASQAAPLFGESDDGVGVANAQGAYEDEPDAEDSPEEVSAECGEFTRVGVVVQAADEEPDPERHDEAGQDGARGLGHLFVKKGKSVG